MLYLELLRHGETEQGGGLRGSLDDALTEGKPLWLHALARRAVSPPVWRADPLKPALEALRRYHVREGRWHRYARSFVPVRLRAAWIERVRERQARRRRDARG